MDFFPKRVLASIVIGVALAAGAGLAPASAAIPGTTVITVKGHVTEPDGTPVAGVTVQADCGCDSGTVGGHTSGKDTTSSTGYYSFRIQRTYALNLSASDPKKRYLTAGRTDGGTTKNGTGYIVDVRMSKASVVAGTVLTPDGTPTRYAEVTFHDPATGKEVGFADLDAKGNYSARIKAGDYKVEFGGAGFYVNSRWYGGDGSLAASPIVSVGYGKSVSGIDGTITLKPTISGSLTFDGKKPLTGVSERSVVTLTDSQGALVDKRVSSVISTNFSFVSLHAGVYTLSIRPTTGSGAYFTPVSRSVTLTDSSAVDGLVIDLALKPTVAPAKRSVGLSLDPKANTVPTTGKVFRAKIIASSYGSVKGARVAIFVNGKKVDTRTLPASGRINWSATMPKVVVGEFEIKLKYLGTSTTKARTVTAYSLNYA